MAKMESAFPPLSAFLICSSVFHIPHDIMIYSSEAAPAEGERRVGTSVRRSTTCGAKRVGLGSQTHFLILRDFFNMEPWGRRYGDRRRRRAQPSSFWVFLEAAKQRKGGYMLTLSTHKTHWFSLPSISFRSSATEGGRPTTRAGRGAPWIGSTEGARAVAKSYEWTGSPPRRCMTWSSQWL